MATILESASRELSAMPQEEQLLAIQEAMKVLPDDQKKAFVNAFLKSVPPPDQLTSNSVWFIVIWAFVLVMVAAVVTLCVSVFVAPVKDATKPEIVLAVFTTVTAFLAGLFATSPVNPKK